MKLVTKMSREYGNSVAGMIQSLCPEEFEKTEMGRVVINMKHRGMSDIMHAFRLDVYYIKVILQILKWFGDYCPIHMKKS